ncbi:MAG: glycosyltransferase family 87 protein [Planctomycetota bacterium]|nr:glycosyltransferase family 87 protein [Planctomycetota bacterium]
MDDLIPLKSPSATDRDRVWLRHALNLWVILAAVVSVKAVVQPDDKTVFPCFADSARNWWADQTMYDSPGRTTGFRYGPPFAVLASPFAVFPNWFGGICWNAAGLCLLVMSIRTLARHVLPGDWPPRREALLLALSLVGSVRGIWSAQSNSFVFAFAAFGLADIARRRYWRASIWLAACVTIKLWPLALVMLLMACRPGQLIGRFSVAICGFFALPFATRPVDIVLRHYSEWLTLLTGPYRTLRQGGYRDFHTILEQFFQSIDDRIYLGLQLATAAGTLAWCLWRSRHEDTPALLTSVFSMWLCWQLLLGPGTERLTFQLAAPMLSWAVVCSIHEQRLIVLSISAWMTTCVLGIGAIERSLLPHVAWSPAFIVMGMMPFVVWQILRAVSSPAIATARDVSPMDHRRAA